MKMRKIKVETWAEQRPGETVVTVNTRTLIRTMMNQLPPNKVPRGVDAFNIMKELHDALKESEKSEYIMLPENVFTFLEKNCFTSIPAVWALMEDVSKAITELIEAELVDVKVEEKKEVETIE